MINKKFGCKGRDLMINSISPLPWDALLREEALTINCLSLLTSSPPHLLTSSSPPPLPSSPPHPLIPSSPHPLIPSSPHPLIPSSPHPLAPLLPSSFSPPLGCPPPRRIINHLPLIHISLSPKKILMLFSEIPGLTLLKEKLKHAVKSNHVAHAQLFSGSPGSLNLPMAAAFSQYIHCTNQGDDSCGQCPACVKSAKFIHPDTHFFFPYTAKTDETLRTAALKEWRLFLKEKPFGSLNDWTFYYKGEDKNPIISVETGREMLRSLLLKPYESHCKAVIIWLPELMHFSTSNVILKMLEEPPTQTYFILVTNESEQLLPTIISRTQAVRIPMLTDEDLRHYLTS